MFSSLYHNRFIYILSNLIVIPAAIIPKIECLANLSFVVAFFSLVRFDVLLSLVTLVVFIVKNNSNYRFNLLLKLKGQELAKSDYECVYLYAWCTLLRYLLIGMCANQIYLFFN